MRKIRNGSQDEVIGMRLGFSRKLDSTLKNITEVWRTRDCLCLFRYQSIVDDHTIVVQ